MRQFITLFLIGLSVGLDGFAVAISIGLSNISKSARLRIAIIFGLFETGMPIIGIIAGGKIVDLLNGKAGLIGGLLLIATALLQLISGRSKQETQDIKLAAKGWRSTIIAALAISIDNLVIGFGLGTKKVSLPMAAAIIGIVSIGLVIAGLEFGRRIGNRVGVYGDYLASLILILVGLAIIFKLF